MFHSFAAVAKPTPKRPRLGLALALLLSLCFFGQSAGAASNRSAPSVRHLASATTPASVATSVSSSASAPQPGTDPDEPGPVQPNGGQPSTKPPPPPQSIK